MIVGAVMSHDSEPGHISWRPIVHLAAPPPHPVWAPWIPPPHGRRHRRAAANCQTSSVAHLYSHDDRASVTNHGTRQPYLCAWTEPPGSAVQSASSGAHWMTPGNRTEAEVVPTGSMGASAPLHPGWADPSCPWCCSGSSGVSIPKRVEWISGQRAADEAERVEWISNQLHKMRLKSIQSQLCCMHATGL